MTSLSEHLTRVYGSTDPETLQQAYRDWARDYNTDLAAAGYSYPQLVPALVTRHVTDTASAILDAGAGTGWIGGLLRVLGYHNITGIDLSEDMLAVAASTGAYRALQAANLAERLDFADHHFDACYSAGTLTPGHAPPHGFRELARVVRPGGPVIVTLIEAAWTDYGGALNELCEAGALVLVERTPPFPVFPYSTEEADLLARLEVYRVP